MKIKSIAAICKKNKNIAIFERYSNDGDILTQYIGDGSAVYPVVGLPQLDKESLLTIFDVPEKDRDNYFVKTLGVPAGISFEDMIERMRKGRCIYAKTGAGAERTDGIQRDCESERPCKAHLHDHEFDGALPEEIPFYAGKPHTG